MSNAKLEKELSFMAPDKVGLLNEISRSLADAGVNIVSLTAYEMDGNANFMMVASDSAKAKEVLESKGYKADINEVVLYELENKVGGAFGAFGWSGEAPERIYNTMDHVLKMDMVGEHLRLKTTALEGGIQMAQDYGRKIARKLESRGTV